MLWAHMMVNRNIPSLVCFHVVVVVVVVVLVLVVIVGSLFNMLLMLFIVGVVMFVRMDVSVFRRKPDFC